MILDLLSTYTKLSSYSFEKQHDDNFVDKLIRKFTAIILVIFAVLTGVYQLVGSPIQCWCQNEYTKPRCSYATTFCYITSLYIPVGNATELPKREDLESHRILYYQWVPFIFLFQAFLFYLPSMLWRSLYSRSEYTIKDYIQTLKTCDCEEAEVFVSHHIQTCIDYKNNYQNRGMLKARFMSSIFGANCGFYLCFSYLLTKLFYLAVIVFQILSINYWLKDEHYRGSSLFGWHNWQLTERFPRMTLCKFQVYILQDAQTHWVQCTLPINIYLEKMYLIIWTWLWVLLVLVLFDLGNVVRLMCSSQKLIRREIIRHQHQKQRQGEDVSERVEYFSVKPDTALVLDLIRWNTNKYHVSAIINNLYDNFLKFNDE